MPARQAPRGLPRLGAPVGITAVAGVSVTMGVSNATGAWTEVIAATSGVAQWLSFGVTNTSAPNNAIPVLCDIGVGPAASEVAIVSSMSVGQIGQSTGHATFLLPVYIQAGARIAVRMTTAHAAGATANVAVTAHAAARGDVRQSPPSLVAIGANVASSLGVAVTTANTWTEVTAATAQPFQGLILTYGLNDSSMSTTSGKVSLGVGASGAEVAVAEYTCTESSNEFMTFRTGIAPTAEAVGVGSRLAVKSANGNSHTGSAVVLGIPHT